MTLICSRCSFAGNNKELFRILNHEQTDHINLCFMCLSRCFVHHAINHRITFEQSAEWARLPLNRTAQETEKYIIPIV